MKNFGFGTKIDAQPIVSNDGRISMHLAVKAQSDSIDLGTVPPSRLTREASTAVTLSEGQTFLINGLIDDRFRNAASRVPALGDLPIVGSLFQSQGYRSGASELILFVTPQIVSERGKGGSEAKTGAAGLTAGPNRKFTLSGCFGYGLYGGGDFNAAMAGSNDFLDKYSPGHTGQYDSFKSGFSGGIEGVYWLNKNMGVGLGIDWYRSGFSGDRIEFQEGTAKSVFTNDASVNVVPVELNFHYQRDICEDMYLDFFFGPGLYFGCFDFNEAYDLGTNGFTGAFTYHGKTSALGFQGGVNIGGQIVKDRLWWFGGVEARTTSLGGLKDAWTNKGQNLTGSFNESGNNYKFWTYDFMTGGQTYRQFSFASEAPSGSASIQNAKEGSLGGSAFSLKAGLKLGF